MLPWVVFCVCEKNIAVNTELCYNISKPFRNELVGDKMDTYIIIGTDKKAYRSYVKVDADFSRHDINVIGTTNFKDARIFRSYRWAVHRARFLTSRSKESYYVYLRVIVDGKIYYHVTDEHINDEIFERDRELEEEISDLINDWKKKKRLNIMPHD